MIRINLLPVKAAQKKEKLKGQLVVALIIVLMTFGLCGLAYMQMHSWLEEAKQEVESRKTETARLTKAIGEVNEFKKRQETLQAKLDVLDKLEQSRRGPVMLLDGLYKAMPEKLWLESFKENGAKATISGMGINEETVALFMRDLDLSKEFANVALKGTQLSVKDGIKLNKFELECDLEGRKVEPPPGPPAKPGGKPKK